MKANANVSIQVLPLVKDYVPVVDKVIEMIAATGVDHIVGPLETTMEGDLDELMLIVAKAQKICIEEGAGEVFSTVKIAYNPDGVLTMMEKTDKYNK